MTKYHVNKKGIPTICKAITKPCPLGGLHFDSMKETESYLKNKFEELGVYQEKLLTCQEYNGFEASRRTAFVQREVQAHLDDGKSTDKLYYNDETQSWTPERTKVHQEILSELMEKYKNVPCDKRVVFSAGLPGAGKTTVLKEYEKMNPDEWAIVSADDIKEMLAEKGFIPEIEGLAPMECSTLVHEESSMLAKTLINQLSKSGKNVVYDFTCKNTVAATRIILEFQSLDYKPEDMQFVFVDISPEVAKERAKARYQRGLNQSLQENNLTPLGGRFLPENVITQCIPKEGNKYSSTNALAIIELHTSMEFNLPPPKIYNNVGDSPIQISFEDFLQ